MAIVLLQIFNKIVPKEKELCKCLSIIVLDSVIKAKTTTTKKYYLQVILEGCRNEFSV